MCTKMACAKDLMHIIKPKTISRQKQVDDDIDDIFSIQLKEITPLPIHGLCSQGHIYKRGCKFCFCHFNQKSYCVRTKRKCTSRIEKAYITEIESPEDVYPVVNDDEFIDLPDLPHVATKCDPGKVYRVVCDVCLCLYNGNLLCTNRLCLSQDGINRKQAARWNGFGCKAKPEIKNHCLKCECVGDKLSCTAIPGCKPVLRTLHGDFRRNETSLAYEKEKCTPSESYSAQCNSCHCQDDGSLRCTQKTCLNHKQSEALLRHREELEKNGI